MDMCPHIYRYIWIYVQYTCMHEAEGASLSLLTLSKHLLEISLTSLLNVIQFPILTPKINT